MKKIKGNLILKKDTEFIESIKVEGDIKGYYNLKVAGDINAENINVRNIDAWDINAENINAENINVRNIDAWDIICENRFKKKSFAKTICRVFIKNKSEIEKKEQEI